jgi:hypothetical protein
LDQTEQDVEMQTEIQTVVLYLANPVAGQSPGGFKCTESVCVGDEKTTGTSEYFYVLCFNSTTYLDSLDLPVGVFSRSGNVSIRKHIAGHRRRS